MLGSSTYDNPPHFFCGCRGPSRVATGYFAAARVFTSAVAASSKCAKKKVIKKVHETAAAVTTQPGVFVWVTGQTRWLKRYFIAARRWHKKNSGQRTEDAKPARYHQSPPFLAEKKKCICQTLLGPE
nr:hypothetical protein [Pandoravirus massiliensis]